MKFDLLDTKGNKSGGIELNDSVWSVPFNGDLVAQCVYVYRSNQRSGDANAKTRSQVSGGGRKPWKQKGTGRARVGSIRSPLWVGGGVTFSPSERNWKKKIPKKMKTQALSIMLSKRLKDQEVKFVKDLSSAERSELADVKGLTVVTDNKEVYLKFRNMDNTQIVDPKDLNVYGVLAARNLIVDESAVAKLEERLSDGK